MKSNNQVKSVKSTVAIASRSILFASLGMAGLLTSSSVHADTLTWGCVTGNWESAGCWNTNTIPGSNDYVNVAPVSGYDTTLYFTSTAGIQSVNSITIDSPAVNWNYVLFTQSAGSLSAGNETVGNGGTGTFTQSGGTNTISTSLYLGNGIGSSGTYNQSSTGTLSAGYEFVGVGGTGTFTQSGGTNTVSNLLTIGTYNSSSGTYNLSSSGTLSAGYEIVGEAGTGTFTQSGGTNTVSNNLSLGYGGSGTYNLSDNLTSTGILSASNEYVGNGGTGTFTQSGGINTVSNNLYLGIGSSGTYNLRSTASLSAGTEIVGDSGTGTFTQSGGTNTVSNLYLGNYIGSSGTYNLNGGTLNVGSIAIGAGVGVFNWTSGSLIYGSNLSITSGSPLGQALTLNAGMDLYTPNLTIAADGAIYQNGGTNTVAGLMSNNGVYTLSGGSLAVNGSLDNSGSFNLSGGTLTGTGALANNAAMSGFGTIAGSGGFTNNALFTQSGGNLTLSNTGSNANYGNMNLAYGNQLRLVGATLDNGGTIALNNAIINGTGTLSNDAGGVITGSGTIASNFNNNGGVLALTGGTTNITQAFSNSGAIQLGGITANLRGGAISNSGTIQGFGNVGNNITNTGTINAMGGTLALSGTVTNSGGLMTAASGSTLLAVQGMASNAGVVNLTGGTFDNNNHALNNTGQISGYGIFRTGGLINNGTMTLSGGTTTVNGDVTNSAGHTLTVAYSPAIFTGNVTNNGTFKSTSTSVTFAGNYTENGSYVSDPAINNFTNLTVGKTGHLTGGVGDVWSVGGNFINHSIQSTLWNTSLSKLVFTGGSSHTFDLAGQNLGANSSAFSNNFSWGILNIHGTNLVLGSGNSNFTDALYINDLQGANISGNKVINIMGNGLDIYYNPHDVGNAYLGDNNYALVGGGNLIASVPSVPEPGEWALMLAGLGLIGFIATRRKL